MQRLLVLALVLAAAVAQPAGAADIRGRVQSRFYTAAGPGGFGDFIILARTADSIFTVTPDENGEFVFTDVDAAAVVEIAWDQVGGGEYVLWPLWHRYRPPSRSYDFEIKSLDDLQQLAKVAIARALETGDMAGADRTLDRVLNLYAALADELREQRRIDRYEYALLRDVTNASARRRDVLGRSKVPAQMIETERKWLRQIITVLSQVPEGGETGFTRIERGIVAAANWNSFARKAYRHEQRRWPGLSIDEAAALGEPLFAPGGGAAPGGYRDWMLEDLLLVRDLLRDPKVAALIERRRHLLNRIADGGLLLRLEEITAREAAEIRLDHFAALIDALRALLRLARDPGREADAGAR